MSTSLIDLLRAVQPAAILGSHNNVGDATVIVAREHLLEVMTFLRDDPRCRMDVLMDVAGVDYLDFEPALRHTVTPLDVGDSTQLPRFEVVYHLLSMPHRHRIRVKVALPEDDLHVQSLCDLWISANWGEREAWDMYGVKFDGHPDLKRVLMYEEFVGHPLRKDYGLRGYQPLVPMPNLADYTDNETYR
jgi:NADH-quinone oxidoreductase subunit C